MEPTEEWYPWMLAIRRTHEWKRRGGWQQAFRDAGQRLGFPIKPSFFSSDGQLYNGKHPSGRYRFLEVSTVRDAFAQRGWFDTDVLCPWVGEVAGFLNWEWWTYEVEDRLYDAERFIAASKGYIVRLQDHRAWNGICENDYQLSEANQKHGFGSGSDLLELGAEYDDYVWRAITSALDRVGLDAKRITYGTSHNRFRFDDFVLRSSQTAEQAWGLFNAHQNDTIAFWVYNPRKEELAALIAEK